MSNMKSVVVTGGAGYVGAVLVPKLLRKGYRVKVLDLYLFGDSILDAVKDEPRLVQVKGDIRNKSLVEQELRDADTVIHLACISNDPSFELNPALAKTINYDATKQLIDSAKQRGVRRFIFASSSSVYGVKDEENVTEDMDLDPLTDYSKYKMLAEEYLLERADDGFDALVLRPATVCGYSPRQRLDLTVNILTNHAINRGKITVFGGGQKRPNIHVDDITDLYVDCLSYPSEKIAGEIFNVGYENHTVDEIAGIIRNSLGNLPIEIVREVADDNRSYHISSEKIRKRLGFVPRKGIEQAVCDLRTAFADGKIPNPMTDSRYYNIRTMQEIHLK